MTENSKTTVRNDLLKVISKDGTLKCELTLFSVENAIRRSEIGRAGSFIQSLDRAEWTRNGKAVLSITFKDDASAEIKSSKGDITPVEKSGTKRSKNSDDISPAAILFKAVTAARHVAYPSDKSERKQKSADPKAALKARKVILATTQANRQKALDAKLDDLVSDYDVKIKKLNAEIVKLTKALKAAPAEKTSKKAPSTSTSDKRAAQKALSAAAHAVDPATVVPVAPVDQPPAIPNAELP